jgi:tetraacyldisaccharide 4'-kinase
MHEPAFWYRPPSLMSLLLSPLAAVYGAVAGRRLQRKGFEAGVPVICVGNYHAGGAGKTPTVRALVNILRDLGEAPVVLSRGYGGRLRGPVMVDPEHHLASDVGDEPLMLAQTVPVAVARERIDGLALAKSQGASVIVMDDGFQNPAIAKDVALIVIDAYRGLGNTRVFPAGPLRAPLSPQIDRTDALIVIGEGRAADAAAARVVAQGKPVLAARLKADAAVVSSLRGRRVLAFAGIGDPDRFFRMLGACGVEVVSRRAFADHHPFTQGEIEPLLAEAKSNGLIVVTTEKDLVRLGIKAKMPQWAQGILAFPVTLEFENTPIFRKFVSDRLFQMRQSGFRKD